MPLTPTTAQETRGKIKAAQWLARSWFLLILLVVAVAAFAPTPNLNWTIANSITIILIALVHGVIVLLAVGRARTAVTLHARAHDMLLCPKDYTPTVPTETPEECTCPTCSLTINQQTLSEFWTDTLTADQYWKRWLVNRRSALAELPYSDSEDRARLHSDAIASKVARARLSNWIVLVLATILVLIVVLALTTNILPRGFFRTYIFLFAFVWAASIFSSWAANKAQTALRGYTRSYNALVCPNDFYPLVETDTQDSCYLCPECGLTTTKPECRSFWQSTLASTYRWLSWLFFKCPRILQIPPTNPPE